MQSFQGLAAADFKNKAKTIVSKFEIFIDPNWINLCSLGGKNYLVEAHYSGGQRELGYEPVAAEFTAVIDDTDGDFHPQNTTGAYKTYFKVGRKIRFSTGFKVSAVDYFWQWFVGVISDVTIDRPNRRLIVKGFDFTQCLQEVKLKSPNNYWGSSVTRSTVAGQADYATDASCNGIYIAYLNGAPIYNTDSWIYDKATKKLFFLPSKIPGSGTNNLIIYYYTSQVPEKIVNDLLMTAGVYVRLENGNFEDWTAGPAVAPDGWTKVEGTIVRSAPGDCKLGAYSAALTRTGTDCNIYQYFHAEKGIAYWQGRTVTFSCWIWCATASRARLCLGDGVGTTYSSYHTGNSTWQLLTVTRTLDAGATSAWVACFVSNGDVAAYFDGAVCVEGSHVLPYLDYTPTGETIERVRFEAGTSVFNAIQKMCERVDYCFYFKYDGTPVFKPIPTKASSLFDFDEELISQFGYVENIDEVRNHIIVEGEEYEIYDELLRILDGSEIMYTLDDVPDGTAYGKVALTSIGAGKIIVAGLDAAITDRMFIDPQAKTNIEAWRHASDVTLIDGGDIYTGSVAAAKIMVGIFGSGNELNNGNFEDWTGGVNVAPDGWTKDGAGSTIARNADPKLGAYCAGLTRIGTDCDIYQNFHAEKGIDYWKGRAVIFSCWVWCAAANRARLGVGDGVGASFSSYHTGNSTWQLLSVTRTLDASATSAWVSCDVNNGDIAGYFDGAMCEEGSYPSPYADKIKNWGHPSNYTLIDGGDIYAQSVTVDKLYVVSLSTITADMGTLVAGKIDIGNIEINADTERILMGAATDPLTGIGIFIGKDGANYEFRCGNPSGHMMHWDGSALHLHQSDTIFASAQEVQEGAARARINITSGGIFKGKMTAKTGEETGMITTAGGGPYPLLLTWISGTLYYLSIDTGGGTGGGGGSGDSCFTAKTKVLMDGGEKHIADLREGDFILTKGSTESPQLVKAKILKVYEHEEVEWYLLVNDILEVTPNHRLFINGVWQAAGAIKIGDLLLGSNDEKIPVESIKRVYARKRVYNLEVEKYKTYFADGVYVHNAKVP